MASPERARREYRTDMTTTETQFQPRFLNSAAFARAKYSRGWLIKRILVRGQPGVLGGAKKTLKTSLAIDMAVSLGTGTPFLGRFPVPEQVRVAVFSGESGEATVQETARRGAEARKVKLDDDCDVLWSFDLPQLHRKVNRDGLTAFLKAQGVKVVIIDPLYLCLLGGGQGASASNLYETGPLTACLRAGATPLFIHHFTKTAGKKTDGLDLDDLAFSGVAEFVRQWLLVGRRTPYQPGTGEHDLLMMVGGSAGHTGGWQVKVKEGVLREDFSGRKWAVQVQPISGAMTVKEGKNGWGS
jgi:replicative DNA helicase